MLVFGSPLGPMVSRIWPHAPVEGPTAIHIQLAFNIHIDIKKKKTEYIKFGGERSWHRGGTGMEKKIHLMKTHCMQL